MKKCNFSKRLNLYLADEISIAENIVLKNHLEDCNECQSILSELQEEDNLLKDFLADYKREELPLELSNKLAAIPQKYKKEAKFSRAIIKFSIAASLLVSFSLGILMTNQMVSSNDDIEFSSNSLADIESLYSYAGE